LVGENWNTKLYVGLNVQDQFISPPDPGNPVVGVRAGVKVQGDAWVNPTKETMLFGIASYSTAFRTYYSNFKVGYDIFNGKEIFVGPEIGAQGNERYDQLRVGAHITGLKVNNVSLGFSGGYMHESDVGAGIYGTIDLSYDF